MKSNTEQQHALPLSKARATPHFALSIRRELHGPEVRRVEVPSAYLNDFHQELLLAHAYRHGMPDAKLGEMKIDMAPIFDEDNLKMRCRGVRVSVVNPRGDTFHREYNASLFSDVASRAVTDLITEGLFQRGDEYHYELVVDVESHQPTTSASLGIDFGTQSTQEPLPYLKCDLTKLLAQAEPVDGPNETYFPVLYTREAFERAERCARRGADHQPPCETGAALIGSTCSCPKTGEFFLVVANALELTDAEEERTRLAYTGKTWVRLQAVLKAIQSRQETRTYRLLGQAHGHNFLPLDGAPPCDICATAKVCGRTSVFASTDDRSWHQAVFGGAPYALCHIFGLNARREEVHGLFSLSENRLTQRGFYIIPDFDPTQGVPS